MEPVEAEERISRRMVNRQLVAHEEEKQYVYVALTSPLMGQVMLARRLVKSSILYLIEVIVSNGGICSLLSWQAISVWKCCAMREESPCQIELRGTCFVT